MSKSRLLYADEKRTLYGQQPSQFIILDTSLTTAVMSNIIRGLKNVLSLAVTLSGPCRIPLFGLGLIGDEISMVVPIQNTRHNPQHLIETLDTCFGAARIHETDNASSLIFPSNSSCASNFEANLLLIYQQILGQHKECLSGMISNSVSTNATQRMQQLQQQRAKVEITIVSNNVNRCVKAARGFCRANAVECIKRIHVVQPKLNLSDTNIVLENNVPDQVGDSNISWSAEENFDDVTSQEGIIELRHLQSNHEVVFEDLFKEWLLNHCSDREHLHIILPQLSTEESITIKCDILECIINASSLPCAADFLVELDHTSSRALSNGTSAKSGGRVVPLYRLEVVAQVPADGVCDSLIFGPPCLVRPTLCWRLDLKELTLSQMLFQDLVKRLCEKDYCLILKYPGTSVIGHFLLLPAGNACILKSLASRELFLPRLEMSRFSMNEAADEGGSFPSDVIHQVDLALKAIPDHDQYNPIAHSSGLYSAAINSFQVGKQRKTALIQLPSSHHQILKDQNTTVPISPTNSNIGITKVPGQNKPNSISFGYAEKRLKLDMSQET